MKPFVQRALNRLESLAPHLHAQLSFAKKEAFSFPTFPEGGVCAVGVGFPSGSGPHYIIEPSIDRLASFLCEERSLELLEQEDVFLFGGDEVSVLQCAWRIVAKDVAFYDVDPETMHTIEGVRHIFQEYVDFGVQPFRNALANISKDLSDVSGLKGSCEGMSAVVCGAGPTLDLLQPSNSLIIGCGSAIQKLVEKGIEPDFACMLDPSPPHERYEKSAMCPLVFLSRSDAALVEKWAGPLYLVGSNTCHPFEDYMLAESGIAQIIQGGWNAGTLGIAWAKYLGCDPIYRVGMDATVQPGERGEFEANAMQECFDGTILYVPHKGTASLPLPAPKLATTPFDPFPLCKQALASLQGMDSRLKALHELELTENPISAKLLDFLWGMWKYVLGDESEESRLAFYKRVLDEYAALGCSTQTSIPSL